MKARSLLLLVPFFLVACADSKKSAQKNDESVKSAEAVQASEGFYKATSAAKIPALIVGAHQGTTEVTTTLGYDGYHAEFFPVNKKDTKVSTKVISADEIKVSFSGSTTQSEVTYTKIDQEAFRKILDYYFVRANMFESKSEACQAAFALTCSEAKIEALYYNQSMDCSVIAGGQSLTMNTWHGLAIGRNASFVLIEDEHGRLVPHVYDMATVKEVMEKSLSQAQKDTAKQRIQMTREHLAFRYKIRMIDILRASYDVELMDYSDNAMSMTVENAEKELVRKDFTSDEDFDYTTSIGYVKQDGSIGSTSMKVQCLVK